MTTKNEKIIYIDDDIVEVTVTTLLIRVDSVIRTLGSTHRFQEIFGGTIVTNGKCGRTIDYAIGSMIKRMNELKEFFRNHC